MTVLPLEQPASAENIAPEPELFRVEVRQRESSDVLVLAGSLGPEAVVRLHHEALHLAAGDKPVAFDWSDASYLSAGALQVLLALRAALSQRGLEPHLAGDNPAIRRSLDFAGLSAHFPQPGGLA